jgi:hypothetical protein
MDVLKVETWRKKRKIQQIIKQLPKIKCQVAKTTIFVTSLNFNQAFKYKLSVIDKP